MKVHYNELRWSADGRCFILSVQVVPITDNGRRLSCPDQESNQRPEALAIAGACCSCAISHYLLCSGCDRKPSGGWMNRITFISRTTNFYVIGVKPVSQSLDFWMARIEHTRSVIQR